MPWVTINGAHVLMGEEGKGGGGKVGSYADFQKGMHDPSKPHLIVTKGPKKSWKMSKDQSGTGVGKASVKIQKRSKSKAKVVTMADVHEAIYRTQNPGKHTTEVGIKLAGEGKYKY